MTNRLFFIVIIIFFSSVSNAQQTNGEALVKLNNPVTVGYIKTHLKKTTPRIVLTPAIEKILLKKIKTDPVVKNYYEAIRLNAGAILNQPLLEKKLTGMRLLSVSREMLYRMSILSIVYRIEKDPVILGRIADELHAVCNFSDWNPAHFLDVAEMSLAVAIAIDWTGSQLQNHTVRLAKESLIEKGILPGFSERSPWWLNGSNNWNQVCNGGMIAAAIAIADVDPKLAARTISRSLDGIPYALKQYSPDGVYPEGASYWGYGTSFSVATSSILRSAFGTDFGIAAYPALIKSADFRLQCVAPSGMFYNFADCSDFADKTGDITLAWFAKETGNAAYLGKEKWLTPPASMGKLPRFAGIGLIWLAEFQSLNNTEIPLVYSGNGSNPIVIFRGAANDPHSYYFAGKGGRASLNHGNMDAGSFVFELDGVRWAIDPGVQDYNTLEQTGFDLWGMCQNCQRWTLLTKGNQGHSTLTVNNSRFQVNGEANLIDFFDGDQPSATFNMTPVLGSMLEKAERTFLKDTDHSITIEDRLILNDSTRTISWTMMTTADVISQKGGALLKHGNKSLQLSVQSPEDIQVSVVMLDPPPLELDKKIKGLKRIELCMPAYLFKNKSAIIKVRLSSVE